MLIFDLTRQIFFRSDANKLDCDSCSARPILKASCTFQLQLPRWAFQVIQKDPLLISITQIATWSDDSQ